MCLVKFAFAYTYAPLHKFCACLIPHTLLPSNYSGPMVLWQENLWRRMDFTSPSITVRISSWKWAFQPCWILIWLRTNKTAEILTLSKEHNLIIGCSFDTVGISICMVKLKFAACQMVICYGWNAHFQDDIPTVMDDEVKSILRWRLTCRI